MVAKSRRHRVSSEASAHAPHGFTLVELLVVIGIITVLMGILLPVLGRMRAHANKIKCMSNLRQIGLGLVMYSNENRGYIVPSFNLPSLPGSSSNVTGGPQQPMDGWACILDRDGYVLGSQRDVNTTFYCPDTLDVEGMKDGQTGTDPGKPRGWTDWPMQFVSVGSDGGPKVATTIPKWGYNKIIRVSYWMNAYNPIGSAPADISVADVYYSASIGLGPDSKGKYIHLHKLSSIRHPSQFIVLADGVYMGRQSVTRLGDANSRIGYRHPGMSKANGSSNVAFADGHVESITGDSFPRATGGSVPLSLSRQDNLGSGPTIYADPEAVLGP